MRFISLNVFTGLFLNDLVFNGQKATCGFHG